MNIKNRKDQTEGATRKRRMWEKKKQEDDERKWGGRHMHRDEKGDTRHETGTGRRLNVYFYPWLVHRKRDRPLH